MELSTFTTCVSQGGLLYITVSGLDQHRVCLDSSLRGQVRLQFENEFDQFVVLNEKLKEI